MTHTYEKRRFTYAILVNDPANADIFAELGISDWSIQDPGAALVINRELRRIEEVYHDVETASERFEVVPGARPSPKPPKTPKP